MVSKFCLFSVVQSETMDVWTWTKGCFATTGYVSHPVISKFWEKRTTSRQHHELGYGKCDHCLSLDLMWADRELLKRLFWFEVEIELKVYKVWFPVRIPTQTKSQINKQKTPPKPPKQPTKQKLPNKNLQWFDPTLFALCPNGIF